jgi:hypothetical protein
MPALPAFSSSTLRRDLPPVARAVAVPPPRVVLVALLIAFVVAGQLYDIVVDGDHWPFSSYPMFARPRELLVRVKRLYGVTESGEVPIVVPLHLAPFHEARLMTAFKRIGRREDRDARLEAALRWALERYEALRGAGVHDGPKLAGMRLYVLSWPLDAWAANRDQPDERRLLGEVSR